MWKCKVQIKCKMGICEVQDATPTTLADREHKSTLGKSTRLSISKISLSCLYPNWTQILSVINLQRESGTAPPSRVSSRQHPPHSPPLQVNAALTCVCMYITTSGNIPTASLYYPTASVPTGQSTVSVLLKDMNVETLLT